VRPSALVGLNDDVVAYDFDQAAAHLLAVHEPDAGLVLKSLVEGFGKATDAGDASDPFASVFDGFSSSIRS